MVRKWGSAVVATAMLLSSTAVAFGGTGAQQGNLAPGKAAGVKQAEMMSDHTLWIVLGVAVFAGGIALVLSDDNGGSVTTTTTGTP